MPRAAALIAGGLATLIAFRIVGAYYARGFVLDLGSVTFPTARYAVFLMTWSAFGTLAALLLCLGTVRVASRAGAADTFVRDFEAPSDRRFVAVCAACAFAMALGINVAVLRGARLTDDESAYRFMADLIASGRLSAPSHAAARFFDNAFMINDGRMYAKYFIGWPLLLAPGAAVGLPQLMNPIYFALTVPALYGILLSMLPLGWARAGTILMVTAPMLITGAATQLSHTSCVCALAWAWIFALRAARPEARLREHFGFAALCALAVFIRPNSALAIGLPLAIFWLGSLRALERPARLRALLAMALTVAIASAVLMLVNDAQTGNPFKIAYQRSGEFDAEIGYRYTAYAEHYAHAQWSDPLLAIATAATGLLRLDYDLLGWPIGLLPALFALGLRQARLPFAMVLCFLAIHLPMTDAGIDSFGPAHYYEIALPVLVLTALGFARVNALLAPLHEGKARVLMPSALCALVLCAWLGYFPVRAQALVRMSQDILAPDDALANANLGRAVIFVPRPWGMMCHSKPTKNYVYFRPNNDPDLKNDVLWLNNRSLDENRKVMRLFPGRRGYVLLRGKDCSVVFVPLAKMKADLAAKLPTG